MKCRAALRGWINWATAIAELQLSPRAVLPIDRAGRRSFARFASEHAHQYRSKYLQRRGEAAASITIRPRTRFISSDIRCLELLESVPGMYVSNDRNYPYLGKRGLGRRWTTTIASRPIDGHTLNEQVWGSAPVGSDLPSIDAIERVEVVAAPVGTVRHERNVCSHQQS